MTAIQRTVYTLINARTSEAAVQDLEVADSFGGRFMGLQFRKELLSGKGLMLVPCASVHTCFMRFALDLVMVDKQGRVLTVKRGVKPWRAAGAPSQTHAVIEVTSGNAAAFEAGDRLFLTCSRGGQPQALPRALQFLKPAN